MNSIIIRYSEIGLKGKNRVDFENKLIDNIRDNLKINSKEVSAIKRKYGRIIIYTKDKCDSLKDVFGIASFSHAIEIEQDMDRIKKEVLDEVKKFDLNEENNFRIEVQRVDKKFSKTSMEVACEIGTAVVNETDAKVKLKNPEFTFYIELIDGKAYVFSEKIQGHGGLPVGSSGKVACLLSTGLDSPIASLMVMKRGCRTVLIFNYNYPFAGEKEKDYALAQFKNLKRFDPKAKLYIVPFGKVHQKIKDKTRPKLWCVLCKRFMYRVANIIAEKEKAKAIVTGESIGQVASQTIENLFCLDRASDLPVLRPVIGMNKQEVIDIAKQIGTYEASIKTLGKCGLLPQCPATKARLDIVEREEEKVDFDIVQAVVDEAEIFE